MPFNAFCPTRHDLAAVFDAFAAPPGLGRAQIRCLAGDVAGIVIRYFVICLAAAVSGAENRRNLLIYHL